MSTINGLNEFEVFDDLVMGNRSPPRFWLEVLKKIKAIYLSANGY